jgi:GGDEF domain-containing protein
MTWLIWGIWYLARNWQQGKPWIFWLAGGQFMLLAAWLGKFVMELGVVDANASVLLAWSALHLMLFTVFSYLALVWRSRLLSHERLKTQSNLAFDPLTGLAKSSEFISAYHRVSLRSESLAYTSGILVLRAGNLSEFSQSMGAENNELGLLWIARILRRCARPQDLVARVSEHSFAVLMDGFEPSMDITSLATKIVSNGLRLQIANAEGVGLKFNMVTMPFSGKDALPSQVLVRMLEKLDMCTDGDKAIHMIKPDSLHDAKSTLATAPAELILTP